MERGWAAIATGVLYAAGGFSLAMQAYMRLLNRWVATHWKRTVGYSLLLGLPLLGLVGGFAVGPTRWALVPAVALFFHLAVEAATAHRHRAHRGMAPVECRPAGHAGWITTHDLRLLRYEVASPWPQTARVRIGHVSDLHMNDRTDARYLEKIAERIAEAAPDLLLLTGDFVFHEVAARRLSDWLSHLPASGRRYAVLGNHDYAVGAPAVREALRAGGVCVLDSRPRRVDLGAGRFLDLAGDDRPWGDAPAGLPVATEEVPLIGLSHSPDNAEDLARAGAWGVFCGHLHGGHIRFPLIGAAALPSRYGRGYERGHYRIGTTHLFVSAGVGSTFPPFRLRCPPDILAVDLV